MGGLLVASFGERMGEPGALWRLAGDLHGTLTADQVAQIVDRQTERLEQMVPRAGDRRTFGRGEGRFGHGLRGGPARLLPDATDEQRAALDEHRAQRETFMEEAKAVRIDVLGLTDAPGV